MLDEMVNLSIEGIIFFEMIQRVDGLLLGRFQLKLWFFSQFDLKHLAILVIIIFVVIFENIFISFSHVVVFRLLSDELNLNVSGNKWDQGGNAPQLDVLVT